MMGVVATVLSCTEARPLPVDRKEGESLRGFVLRLAEAEGCNSDQMRDWLGLPRGSQPLPGPAPRAAELARRPEGEFERMGLEAGDRVWIAGCLLPTSLVVRHRMQVCPACLAADAFHRSVWELASLDVCPIHRARLIDHCPADQCSTKLTWSRWSVRACACGVDLAAKPGPAAPGSCLGAALIYRRLSIPVDGPDLPAAFRKMPVEDLLDLMAFLGRTELVIGRGNPLGLRGKAMSLDARVLDAGAATLLRWPAGFDELAELVRLSRQGESGLNRFGYLHRFIALSGDRSFGPVLRTAYRRFLLSEAGYTTSTLPEFLSPRRDDTSLVTAGEANRMLGMSAAMVARLKATPLWDGIEAKAVRRGVKRLLPRGDVEAVAARVADLISFREADCLLGLKKGNYSGKVSRLVEGGLLPAFPFNVNREAHQLSVERVRVDALLAQIVGAVSETPPRDPVTFSDIFILASRQPTVEAPLVALFRLMIDRQLRGFVANQRAPGLRSLTFEREDAERLVQGMVTASRSAVVPMDEASRMLGLRTPAIHALLRAGLLPSPARRGTTYLLVRAAVDGFWAKFDTPERIAARLGKTPSEVEESLKRLGVEAAGHAVVPGRRILAFYSNNAWEKLE